MESVKYKKRIQSSIINTRRIALLLSLFVVALPFMYTTAAASDFLQIKWFNMNISVLNKKEHRNNESSKIRIENLLANQNKVLKTITLDEADRTFPYKIYRPKTEKTFSLYRSVVGWIDTNVEKKEGNPNHFEPVVYDFYSKGGHWAIVMQSLEFNSDTSVNMTYIGDWIKVIDGNDAKGFFITDQDESRVDLQTNRLEKNHIVILQMVGNLSKGDMIKIAKLYL